MIKFNTLKEIVQFRITENEENYWIEDYWKAAIERLTKDVAATITFLQNDCTDEEFYWLSEIFEDVAEKTQSKELIKVLRDRFATVTPESYIQQSFQSEHMKKWVDYNEYVRSISKEIDYAEGRIKE